MTNPSDEAPIENANEADVAEQAQEADGSVDESVVDDGTVDEEAYPHRAEEESDQ